MLEVSWVMVTVHSPMKDLGGCSMKEREALKYCWEGVGWGETSADIPKGAPIPSGQGVNVPAQREIKLLQ